MSTNLSEQQINLPPSQVQRAQQLTNILTAAQSIEITDDATYEMLADQVQTVNGLVTTMDEERKGFTRPLDDLKKIWISKYQPALDTGERIVTTIKGKLQKYQADQRAKAEAAERQRRAEEKRLQKERDDELARQRQAAEDKAAAEREAAAAAAAAAEKDLQAAVDAGDAIAASNAAEAIDAAAVRGLTAAQERDVAIATMELDVMMPLAMLAPALHAPQAPKVAGVSGKVTYSAEVTDKLKFVREAVVRALKGDPTMLGLVTIDGAALNKLAVALKDAFAYPGAKVITTESLAVGRRR